MEIKIKTIPHSKQRYDTVGDWEWDKNGNLTVSVSDMDNWKYEFLVAFHELAEVMLCKDRGISQESVDEFDISFEKIRQQFPKTIGDQEPGNMSSAPYNKEHAVATQLEYILAQELGVNWNDYDESVNNL